MSSRCLLSLLLIAGFLAPVAARADEPPKDRPNYFGLYPPPPPGTFTPKRPPASTATRRPDLFAPLPVYPKSDTILADGAIDIRNRVTGKQTRGVYIAATRVTIDYIRANPKDGDERGGVRLQALAETLSAANTSPDRLRLSEVYAFYKFLFPGASATVRAGQFVLPFGLAAVYDTAMQPVQTLAEKSVGLRVDLGGMLEGDYGPYHYAASVTTGSGPSRRDRDSHWVLTARLERHFLTQSGRIQIAGSMMTGRLPETTPEYTLPASGVSSSQRFVDKTRFAADTQYALQKLVARGEIVFGADAQEPVYGYFGEMQYGFARGLHGVVALKRWDYATRPMSTHIAALGLNIHLGGGLAVRTLLERERNDGFTPGKPVYDRRLTFQTRFNF